MRKIESLQENERVFVKSKQWREAAKLFNFCAMPLEPVYVGKNDVGYFWEVSPPEGLTVYPLKDFLPVKKSKTKQRLKALEARVDKIEERTPKRLNQCLNFNEVIVGRKDEPNLEVGKWYKAFLKDTENYFGLFRVTKLEEDKVWYYGLHSDSFLNKKTWKERDWASPLHTYDVSEPYQIGAELECYAIRLGFKDAYYDCQTNKIYDKEGEGRAEIMMNGVWVSPVKDQPKEIDFSVAGQYVTTSDKIVVLTTGKRSDTQSWFSGVAIEVKENDIYNKGEYRDNWYTGAFTLLTEPITINPQP